MEVLFDVVQSEIVESLRGTYERIEVLGQLVDFAVLVEYQVIVHSLNLHH